MNVYIISRINIEVPEVCDHERFVKEIHNFIRTETWATQNIHKHYVTVSDPIMETRDITIELVLHRESFAQAHKVTDVLIEKIENYIITKRVIGAWVTGTDLMLSK